MRSLNVKSSLTIESQVFNDDWETGSSVVSEAVVHASVLHWTGALIPFNVKPALAVGD